MSSVTHRPAIRFGQRGTWAALALGAAVHLAFGIRTLLLPMQVHTIGMAWGKVSAGSLVLVLISEAAWLLALWASRRWFRDGTRYRLFAALWLAFTPFWHGLHLGSTAGLAASFLAFLLVASRGKKPRLFTGAVALAGFAFPLTLLAIPSWAGRRRSAALAGIGVLTALVLFRLDALRIAFTQPVEDPAGFRSFAGALLTWAEANPYPAFVTAWWVAAGTAFVLISALSTWGAARPRTGPLVTLWATAWFLASPCASASDLAILLPGCLVWFAQRPSPWIAIPVLWLAIPFPFKAGGSSLGAEAWTFLPLLLLHARASIDLGLRVRVRDTLIARAPAATLALPLAVAVSLLFAFGLSWRLFPIDDAYVHLVYARNLVAGHGMTFNPGEPSTGSTAPLWTLVVAFLHLFPGSLVAKTLLASLASYLASVLLVTLLARRLAQCFAPDRPVLAGSFAALAGTAFAANGNVLWFASTGMETLFFLALGLVSIWSYTHRGFGYRTALLAGLVAACRPEGLLVGGVLLAWELLVSRHPVRKRLPQIFLYALLAAPYFLWVRYLTGSWAPSTFYGKTLTFIATGGFHLGAIDDFFRALWGYWYWNSFAMRPALWFAALSWVVSAAAVVQLARRGHAPSRHLATALLIAGIAGAWGILHFSAYAIRFRSLYHQSRYVAPVYGIVLVLAAGGASALLGWPRLRFASLSRARDLLLFAAFLTIPAFTFAQLAFWRGVYQGNLEHIEHVHLAAAEWMRDNTPEDARVAAFDIGVMGFVSKRYTADMGGLTDPSIHPYLIQKRCGPYLLERNVQWIAHLENPPSEWYTGINLDAGKILRQTFVTSFEIPGYVQPVLTHSTKVAIFRLEPLGPIEPDLAGGEAFFPVDLSAVANASRRGDPFQPGLRVEDPLFPALVETELAWKGIPFRLLEDGLERRETVVTTCYQSPFEVTVPLRPEPGGALWFALDGGRTVHCLTSCARMIVSYADGGETTVEVVPYSDVWDYWEQDEIPPERVVWQAAGTRQSLSSFGFQLAPDRVPRSLTISSTTNGDEGIAIFAATQVVPGSRAERP